ncbi:MAG TPA: hypothetical protein VNX46_06175, partial [Candidatus Acidoferrum sp.]|nr:hypothetical protein [Candidatus Acidoferrum sp.]
MTEGNKVSGLAGACFADQDMDYRFWDMNTCFVRHCGRDVCKALWKGLEIRRDLSPEDNNAISPIGLSVKSQRRTRRFRSPGGDMSLVSV